MQHQYTPEQVARFWSKVKKSESCWRWTGGRTQKGYGLFFTPPERKELAHRVAWRLTHGDIKDGLFICHHCDNPICVRPNHLFAGTNKDNSLDMVMKGRLWFANDPTFLNKASATWLKNNPDRVLRGSQVGTAKMDESAVRQIRLLYATGAYSYASLARRFGVSKTSVLNAVLKRAWRHVE